MRETRRLMRRRRITGAAAALALGLAGGGWAGCDEDDVNEATDKAKSTADDATDKAKDAADDAKDQAQGAADDAGY